VLELADRLLDRLASGHRVVVATVVSVAGSAPTTVGTSMGVDDTGAVLGSIAGGCVEGAVYELCQTVLAGSLAAEEEYGITDDDAFAVGLTCGGVLRVHARELGPADLEPLRQAARGVEAIAVTPLSGPVPAANEKQVRAAADARLAVGRSGLVRLAGPTGPVEVFVEVAAPPARMVVYGALEFSAALATAARAVGYHVTVCDPRPVFATRRRFPDADEVIVEWPVRHVARLELGRRDAVCVMAHDDRFDAELILAALRGGAGYVGAMGSRRTHEKRVAELRALGADAAELARLHSPIGLDIGAATPQGTAVSVLAEVLAARTGASGRSLADLAGPIHRTPVSGSVGSG